ncbi:MAG: hypothetical protein LBE92_09520 [Chryseobacterium sp.]|jgi:nucleoside diphosphate kinase|uniref:hypothetical protein n=1 Tax=Chryseobacterium sp. TaxID=1871047 RepID=UPI00281D9E9E|nr:hypothetical protein [Chryseobacterium sp.]MDR2236352.1 hypothetical protein [Chryseobacterium sp.]
MDHLHGQVKLVKEYVSEVLQQETVYTPEGAISERKLYKKGILSSREKRYEKEGMKIREIQRYGHTPEMIICHFTDPSGNLNKKEYYDLQKNLLDKKDFGTTSIEYNTTGKLVSFIQNGIILYQKQFNQNNEVTGETSFTDSGDELCRTMYLYEDNTITRKLFDAGKKLIQLRYLVLDEKKRILQNFAFSRYHLKITDWYQLYNTEHIARITTEDLKNANPDSRLENEGFPLKENGLYSNEIKKLLDEFRDDRDGKSLPDQPPIQFFNELSTFGYDDNDREIFAARFEYLPDFNHEEITQMECTEDQYDKHGLLIAHRNAVTEKNHDFGGSYLYTYEFDDNNRIIKKIQSGSSSTITAISYGNGNRTEVEETEDGRIFTQIFDSRDNLIYYEDAEKSGWKWSQSYEITYYD